MSTPQLWVWIGSPDDDLDVVRYVKATDQDILDQPVVVNALVKERNRTAQEWGRANAAEKLLAANEGRVREIVDESLLRKIGALRLFVISVEAECREAQARMGKRGRLALTDPEALRLGALQARARALLDEVGP